MLKSHPWLDALLLLFCAITYAVMDLRYALPEWFNWVMAGILPVAAILLLVQHGKAIHSPITVSITLITFLCGSLPLIANMSTADTAYRRDFERVRVGMSEKEVNLLMGRYEKYWDSFQHDVRILEFRKYQSCYNTHGVATGCCLITRFQFFGGRLLHKSWIILKSEPFD